MKMVLGSDHGGFELKNEIIKYLEKNNYEFVDVGVHSSESVDYPDYAQKVCKEILDKNADKGILICGTGIGISIAANKIDGIRCAKVSNVYEAQKSVQHNNANCVALGGRVLGVEIAYSIVEAFLNSEFEAGRHERRVNKIMDLEK